MPILSLKESHLHTRVAMLLLLCFVIVNGTGCLPSLDTLTGGHLSNGNEEKNASGAANGANGTQTNSPEPAVQSSPSIANPEKAIEQLRRLEAVVDRQSLEEFKVAYQQAAKDLPLERYADQLFLRALRREKLDICQFIIDQEHELPLDSLASGVTGLFNRSSDLPKLDLLYPVLRNHVAVGVWAECLGRMNLGPTQFRPAVESLLDLVPEADHEQLRSALWDHGSNSIKRCPISFQAPFLSALSPQQREKAVRGNLSNETMVAIFHSGPVHFSDAETYIRIREMLRSRREAVPLLQAYHESLPQSQLQEMWESDFEMVLGKRLSLEALTHWKSTPRLLELAIEPPKASPDFRTARERALTAQQNELAAWLGSPDTAALPEPIASLGPIEKVIQALKADDMPELRNLLTQGDVRNDIRRPNGASALRLAIRLERSEAISLLIAGDCSFSAGRVEPSPLELAIELNNMQATKELLEAGAGLRLSAMRDLLKQDPNMLLEIARIQPQHIATFFESLAKDALTSEQADYQELEVMLTAFWLLRDAMGSKTIHEEHWRGQAPWYVSQRREYKLDFYALSTLANHRLDRLELLQLEGLPLDENLLREAVLTDNLELANLVLRDMAWVERHLQVIEECCELAIRRQSKTLPLLSERRPLAQSAKDPFLDLE